MIPVLFTDKKSNYKNFPIFDCFDIDRNALTYSGKHSVIAHPPCRLFSRLRKFSTAPSREKLLAYFALCTVISNGGILEHPAHSTLWKECNLPLPGAKQNHLGFSISIDLHWFGYPARKKTWLFISGIEYSELPILPLSFDVVSHCISTKSKTSSLKSIPKHSRSTTPLHLIGYFKQIIDLIEQKKLNT
jgi:hypothetical protein